VTATLAGVLPPLREVIRRHGLAADKRLGQHFLLDPSILQKITHAALPLEGRIVLEVGPGPGGLTRALLATEALGVVAVERDPRCIAALDPLRAAFPERLRIIAADARDTPPGGLGDGRPIVIVANLPYNVGTELLLGWLGELEGIERMVLMFQREVAQRLAAAPGTGDWGRLGVLVQTLCTVERLFDLPAAAFVPPPTVVSSVVRIVPRPDRPEPERVAALELITRAAFGQRRKMLRAALRSLTPSPELLLEPVGVAGERRAETLSLAELMALADAWRTLKARTSPPA